jgi:hypothetical protein
MILHDDVVAMMVEVMMWLHHGEKASHDHRL